MKPIYLIIINFLFSISLFAQSNWRQVNSGTNEFISSIQFEDSLVGYATAGNQILKSVDAGENWVVFHQDTSLVFSYISIYKDSLLIIGLNNATFEKGIYLINKSSTITRNVTNATFLNNTIRKVSSVNDAVWFQTDAAGLVQFKNGLFTIISSDSKYFNKKNYNIIIAANDKVYTSVDNGQIWDTLSFPFYSYPISDSYFMGGDTIIMSYGSFPTFIINSFDKGISWSTPNNINPLTSTFYLNGLTLFGVDRHINNVLVLTSHDGGVNYLKDTLFLGKSLHGVYQFSSKLAFVYGEDGLLFKTTNLGGLVGINENKGFNESDFTIFPNPSQDYLQIKLADKDRFSIKQINILSTNGAILATFQGFQERIELSTYPKGMYIIQLQTDKGSASKSFVVR